MDFMMVGSKGSLSPADSNLYVNKHKKQERYRDLHVSLMGKNI